MTGGTYVLFIDVPETLSLGIGALGTYELDPGEYAYVGSAKGPGGFARVDRHSGVATGERAVRHWHIDYVLGHPETTLAATTRLPGRDCECALARSIPGTPITGVGVSDCSCEAHLSRIPDRAQARSCIDEFREDGRISDQ